MPSCYLVARFKLILVFIYFILQQRVIASKIYRYLYLFNIPDVLFTSNITYRRQTTNY